MPSSRLHCINSQNPHTELGGNAISSVRDRLGHLVKATLAGSCWHWASSLGRLSPLPSWQCITQLYSTPPFSLLGGLQNRTLHLCPLGQQGTPPLT